MREMEWNVYVENFNGLKIDTYNIFKHYHFMEDIKQIYKKHKDDFDTFAEEVKRSLMYYFWSKSEWEVMVAPLFKRNDSNESKIDVYSQVMLNWDIFIKYVWDMSHARKIPRRGKKDAHSG